MCESFDLDEVEVVADALDCSDDGTCHTECSYDPDCEEAEEHNDEEIIVDVDSTETEENEE